MSRVRISTTVDRRGLTTARRLAPGPDSALLDRALAALIERLESDRERAALDAHPYEADPELAWQAPTGPDLPYEGVVPAEVLRLARRRRANR
jgi:hypothetical protein